MEPRRVSLLTLIPRQRLTDPSECSQVIRYALSIYAQTKEFSISQIKLSIFCKQPTLPTYRRATV